MPKANITPMENFIKGLDLDAQRSETEGATSGVIERALGKKDKPISREKLEHHVDPSRCRVWKGHDRTGIWFSEDNCSDLIASYKSIGQQKPAIARKIEGNPEFDYEIIEGARRRWTSEFLQVPLILELRDITDVQAAAMMDSENADRQDISPFERALSYQRLIELKVFNSAREVAEGLNTSHTIINRSLLAASITKTNLINLFEDIRTIPVLPAQKLMQQYNSDDEARICINNKAEHIQELESKPSPSGIIKQLLSASEDTSSDEAQKEYMDKDGNVLVTAKAKSNGNIQLEFKRSGEGVTKRELKKLLNEAIAEYY